MARILGAWAAVAAALVMTVARADALVVDAAYVEAAAKRGAIVWDARGEADYARGHIPGAVNIGDVGDVFRDSNREDPPSAAAAARIFGGAGIDILHKEIIVYSRKGDPFAYYAARMVEYYGGPHAKVFHGGLDDWNAAHKPVETAATRLQPVSLALNAEGNGSLGNKELVERLRKGSAQILDTRTPKEFAGEDIRAIRGGHVPGAINIPYEENWQDPATGGKLAAKKVATRDGMSLKPRDELSKLYAKLDPEKETIVYCQSGVRASETAAVLRDLGFKDVKVHEPSWLGYAGQLSAPADNEVFVNVGALYGRIGSLQARVKDLEDELGKMRAGGHLIAAPAR
ncbi:MAG TPA: rhodanese-like domain-containing protein [Usitatibacter sp.]|nr:rhodanese-like domain-containing protein [Usitatibacter sp.]